MKSLKDKLNGNELDLSLCELTEVPVKELAALPKATHLDLSCNFLLALPVSFSTLNYLIHLDLSKNQLTELPYNFGNLKQLQHLDAYGNQLTTLPVSMCQLKKLRWLDLKNNPLEPKLLSIAGDCLDQKQCQQCANKIVDYLTGVESELEREKQKRLKLERAKQYARKIEEEKEAKRQKEIKKAEKESKRKAKLKNIQEPSGKKSTDEKNGSFKELDDESIEMEEKVSLSMLFVYYMKWTIFLIVALTLILLGTNIFMRLQLGQKLTSYKDIIIVSQEECNKLKLRVVKAWLIVSEKGFEIYLKAQDYVLHLWSQYMDNKKKTQPSVPLSASSEEL